MSVGVAKPGWQLHGRLVAFDFDRAGIADIIVKGRTENTLSTYTQELW